MAQLAEAVRQAGQLSPRARVSRDIDLAEKPRIHVEENRGKSHVMRKLDQELIEELEDILYRCGWVGTFRLIPMGFTKGTPHTLGIRLKEPQKSGILMHLHGKGGNDCNIEAILLKPPAFDSLQFFTTMKFAQEHADDEGTPRRTRKITEQVMEVIPPEPALPAVLPAAEEETLVAAVPKPSPAPDAPVRGLLDDPDNRQLFMEEISKSVDANGCVSQVTITSILVREFKVRPRGVGAIVRALKSHQLLVKAPGKEEHFRLVSPPNPVGTAISRAPEPPTQQEPKAPQPRSTLAAGIEQLERKAGIASRLETRLGQIGRELGEIEPLLSTLTTRKQTLESEKLRLEAKLAEPDLVSAVQKFKDLKKLIG